MNRHNLTVSPSPPPMPAARILSGSVVVRVVWGFTVAHAVRRAYRWIDHRQTEANAAALRSAKRASR